MGTKRVKKQGGVDNGIRFMDPKKAWNLALNQKQQKSFPAYKNQLMNLGFLRIHQQSRKKLIFYRRGVFSLHAHHNIGGTSPLMVNPMFSAGVAFSIPLT
jgi:hypothetical protein